MEVVTFSNVSLLGVSPLSDTGWTQFEGLVAGAAQQTLDDGEAATIAYAVERGAVAILDERKGTRLCASRYRTLSVVSTVDVLLHPDVRQKLGEAVFIDAVFAALRDARMAVFLQLVTRDAAKHRHESPTS